MRPDRRLVIGGLAGLLAASRAVALPEPDTVASELANATLELDGRIVLGNRRGDVILVEFFDYNCPFCRQSARDVRPLLAGDRELQYVLVNYAVLGPPSIEATRVALAFSMQKPTGYLPLHEALFAARGTVGAERAVAAAESLGAERRRLIRDADSDRVTAAMNAMLRLGEALGLDATPSYVIGTEALQGFVSLAEKRQILADFRRCERVSC